MSRDLSAFLNAWPFVQGTISARRIKGRDGLPKVQLRVDLGVLQMEATGRPDGKQPLGHPTWLHALHAWNHRDFHAARAAFESVRSQRGGSDGPSEFYLARLTKAEQLPATAPWSPTIVLDEK